jgi:hypothetical protein
MNQQMVIPEEEILNIFVGNWQNTGNLPPGPFGPGGEITGDTSYGWGLGGKVLQYTSCLELPGMGRYEVQGGVIYNRQNEIYDAYAVNSLGALLVYQGKWTDETTLTFSLAYPGTAGGARVVYCILPGGSIQMVSDRMTRRGEYETYFETNMKRLECGNCEGSPADLYY